MSDEAVRLFDEFCSGFADGNARRSLQVFSHDAKFLAPGISEISGRKALEDFFAGELPNIENYKIDKVETWQKPENAVIEWKNSYTDRRTGKQHQVTGVTIITVKNGLIHQMREYCNIPTT